MRTDCGKSA
jgi:hypothetical protein